MRSRLRRFDFLDQLEIFEAEDYREDFPLHLHDRICMTLVRQGIECTQVREQELISPFQGISFTYPDEIHANPNKNNQGYSFLTFYLSPEVLSKLVGSKEYFFTARVVEDAFLAQALLTYAFAPQASEARFVEILQYLAREYLTQTANYTVGEKASAFDFKEVINFMDEHYAAPLSLDQLAKIKQLSKFSFIRQFKKVKGITPAQYITLKRIEAAKKILRAGNPIMEAVYRAGFYDQSHMSRNFKKITGITPRTYQKACNIVQE